MGDSLRDDSEINFEKIRKNCRVTARILAIFSANFGKRLIKLDNFENIGKI